MAAATQAEEEPKKEAHAAADDDLALVPVEPANPAALQMIAPDEDMPMYEPIQNASNMAGGPAPHLSMENIQAIAVGFAQMEARAVSADVLNADDIIDG